MRIDGHPRVTATSLDRPEVAISLNANTRLTVLCAPTGYGKSTAVALWLQASPERLESSAWVSLAGMDSDQMRTALIELPQDPRLHAVKTLVIDDVSPLTGGRLHELVSGVLEDLPCRIVLITTDARSLPEFALAELGGVLIGSEQLALGREGVATHLALSAGGADDVDPLEIHQLALGWPRAVTTMASMRARDFASLQSALDVWVDHEVLGGLTAAHLELVEATSPSTWVDRRVMELFTASSNHDFDALVSGVMAAGIASIRGAGADMRLVLVPAIRARLLRRRAATDHAALRNAHQQVADWIDPLRHPEVAIYHAVEASDWDLAIEVLDRSWSELFFHHNTVTAWALASLPASVREGQLRLQVGLETALTARTLGGDEDAWHTEGKLASYTRMHRTARSEKSRPGQSLRDNAIFDFWRMVRARHRWQYGEAEKIADAMRGQLARSGRLGPKLDDFGPLLFLQWGITALLAGDHAQARTDFEACFALGSGGSIDFVPRNAVGCLALMDALDGDIPGARTWLERATHLRKPRGRWSRIAMVCENVAAALVAVSEGRVQDATRFLSEPIKIADRDEFWAATLYARALVAQADGSTLSVLSEVTRQQQERSRTMHESGLTSMLASMAEAEIRLSLGQPGRVEAILGALPAYPAARVLNAQARYALGDVQGALDGATKVKWGTAAGPRARTHAALLCLMCYARQGDSTQVVQALSRGQELVELFRLERAWTLVDIDSRKAISSAGGHIDWESHPSIVYPQPQVQDPLTPRELAALRAVADGSSVEEAAGALFVSPNTIRSQLKAAYRKLGASSRAEAIAAAARRGILS